MILMDPLTNFEYPILTYGVEELMMQRRRRRRRANLGLNLSAWDRYMVQRGPRRKLWGHLGDAGLRGSALRGARSG